jgi:hypothetical protein
MESTYVWHCCSVMEAPLSCFNMASFFVIIKEQQIPHTLLVWSSQPVKTFNTDQVNTPKLQFTTELFYVTCVRQIYLKYTKRKFCKEFLIFAYFLYYLLNHEAKKSHITWEKSTVYSPVKLSNKLPYLWDNEIWKKEL